MATANQGARGPLLMWTVISSIASVTAIILAIYFFVDSSHVNERLRTMEAQYAKALTADMMRGEAMANLEAARSDPERGLNASMKLFDVALAQRDALTKMIDGGDNDFRAINASKEAVEKAKSAGAVLTGEPTLVAVIDALVARAQTLATEAANNKADSTASQQKLAETLEATKEQIAKMNQAMDQVRAERDAMVQAAQTSNQQQITAFDGTAEEMRKQLASSQEQISLLNTQNAELGAQLAQKDVQLADLRTRLGLNRVDVTKVMTRQADGKILRVPGNDRVFIDLGGGDHVSPGLTFEVYDKYDGIPAAGDPTNDLALPVGKASIEVITVLPTGSECRIIRKSYGAALAEGDLIVNLVYDRNTKYNFVVFGNFDIDQNGIATPQDAEIIKRQITRWGGTVVEEINVDTDFVVLGKEPVIPDPPDPNDPLAVAEYERALAGSEAYDEISRLAREYRLPILNQNRFLYLTGYYSQVRR